MIDINKSITLLNSEADRVASENLIKFQSGKDKTLKYGERHCARFVKNALIYGGASIKNSGIESAKDYGPWLLENGFVAVQDPSQNTTLDSISIIGQKKGDVVVIQSIAGHKDGHMAMFNGEQWVSDFKQANGFYSAQAYRTAKTPFVLYRYTGNQPEEEKKDEKTGAKLIKIVFPIPKNERGQEFSNLDEIMAHVSGESTGNYLLGRNGMWHSGIHITNATTPWCALSGNAITEKASFPIPYKGQQAIRCMADGEIVAYRMNQDYLPLGWKNGSLNLSGSFVLVRHYIQPGETQKSGLHFYTLYMHLAPYSAYQANPTWITQDKLPTYSPEWKAVAGTKAYKNQSKLDSLPKGSIVSWDKHDSQRQLKAANERLYGLVTIEKIAGTSKLNVGAQCWTLVDNNNILPEIEPSWWKQLASPSKEMMQFDKVVSLSTPISIKAGNSIGHMGFYQAPKEQGIDSRYQVHIECFSADDNLPQFLQNPEMVGQEKPEYLKCLPGLMLWNKQGDDFIKTESVVEWEKIFKLSELKTEKSKDNKEFYLLPEYLGAIPKITLNELSKIEEQKTKEETFGPIAKIKLGAIGYQEKQIKENIYQFTKFLSQYDLAGLGFKALIANADAFDHLNGYAQPQVEFISSVYENIKAEITGSSVPQKGIIAHNYQRLINKIKSDKQETYSPEEYRRAFHNPMFSHIVNKTIVKHPSDWYYKKSDSVWQKFLNILSEEAPLWRSYSEEFLDSMIWMQDVTNEKIDPEVWHMHPMVFLASFLMQNYPVTPIENTLTSLEFLNFYNGDIIDDNDFLAAAEILGCEVAAIKAVAKTETGNYGSYFKFQDNDDYVPAILFERHHFRKYTSGRFDHYADISNSKAGGYGSTSTQYAKLLKAYNLDKTAALKSASWGKFQILGSNYLAAGYSTPENFVLAISESEKNQLDAFVNFIKSNRRLLKSIRDKDWLTFARTYNGPSQKGYDKKIEKNYETYK